jgi:pyroglutamyl-peptidase
VRLLATGFGPFPGAPVNPTGWLMEDLRTWAPEGWVLATHVLDVTYDVWEKALSPLIAEHRPEAVVAFGLSANAKGFQIETTARNVLDPSRSDANGAFPHGTRIAENGPATYASTLSFEHAHAVSDDAGSYVCNLTLYRLLENGVRATFVHLPAMPEEQLRAGARAILEAAAHSVRAASSRRDDVPVFRKSAAT